MLSWECNNCGFINLAHEPNCLRCGACAYDDMTALRIIIEVDEEGEPGSSAEAPMDSGVTVSRRRFQLF